MQLKLGLVGSLEPESGSLVPLFPPSAPLSPALFATFFGGTRGSALFHLWRISMLKGAFSLVFFPKSRCVTSPPPFSPSPLTVSVSGSEFASLRLYLQSSHFMGVSRGVEPSVHY